MKLSKKPIGTTGPYSTLTLSPAIALIFNIFFLLGRYLSHWPVGKVYLNDFRAFLSLNFRLSHT